MDPATILAGVSLIEGLIQEEPAIAAEFQTLFSKGKPTPADFAALRARVAAETYKQFVPQTQLQNP